MKISEKIVNAILEDISDRAGWSKDWDYAEENIRQEIRETWAGIIENELKNHGNGNL